MTDSGWQGTARTFNYYYAAWVETTVPLLSTTIVDEDPPCDASVTITAPESLPRLPDSDQYGVTVGYDFGNAWPVDNAGNFVIELPSYNGKSEQQISNPVGEYTFYPFWTLEDTARRCIAGEGKISTDVKVTLYPASGAFIDTPLWSYTGYVETDCSIAVEPRPATYIAEACGYTDDRIQVPIQSGIHNHTISWDGNVATITYIPMPVHELIGGPFTVTITEDPCVIDKTPVPTSTRVCGPANDIIDIGFEPGNAPEGTFYETSEGWVDGTTFRVMISALPGWMLPEGIEAEYTFVDEGDCLVTPNAPEALVAVCGPDNDILSIPSQPEGITVEDSSWVENERVIEFIPAEGYAIAEGARARITFSDDNIPCEVDPVGTTLVLRFETSDGGSLEGEAFRFYAPVASQQSGEPFIEGEIGAGNTVVLEEIIAGTYRIAILPEGYEPIDELIIVTAEGATEEHVIGVQAIQPVETPTPSPTVAPTVEPTAETTKPAVTGLPATGSGPGVGFGWISVAMIVLALLAAGARRPQNM